MAWWQAFTEVAEPKHYPKLKKIFLSHDYFVIDHAEYLKILPDFDFADLTRSNVFALDKKIEQILARERFGCPDRQKSYRRAQIAAAAQAGDVDMLGRLIDELHNPKQNDRVWFYSTNRIDTWRNHVTRVIDFKGSNAEMRSWFEANRENLVFDNFTKQFILIEDF